MRVAREKGTCYFFPPSPAAARAVDDLRAHSRIVNPVRDGSHESIAACPERSRRDCRMPIAKCRPRPRHGFFTPRPPRLRSGQALTATARFLASLGMTTCGSRLGFFVPHSAFRIDISRISEMRLTSIWRFSKKRKNRLKAIKKSPFQQKTSKKSIKSSYPV